MVEYKHGNTQLYLRKRKTRVTSIMDIRMDDGPAIYVLPGEITENDILVRYQDFRIPRSRARQPSHIHWAVDLLLKWEHEPELVKEFLTVLKERWSSTEQLSDREFETIRAHLSLAHSHEFIERFAALEGHGFFSVTFLVHLMELLMLQEKTNNPDAYMFKNVVDEIGEHKDLYSIISAARYRGS